MWLSRKEYLDLKDKVRIATDLTNKMWERLGEVNTSHNLLLEKLGLAVFEESEKPKKKVLLKKAEYVKRMKERGNTNIEMYGESISDMLNQQLASCQQSGMYQRRR